MFVFDVLMLGTALIILWKIYISLYQIKLPSVAVGDMKSPNQDIVMINTLGRYV